MIKYMAIIDSKAETGKIFGYVELKAKNIIEAMNEAEGYINENVYMIFIAQKTSKVLKVAGGKEVVFKNILANRKNGWHVCDDKHSERTTSWKVIFTKSGNYYEIAEE